MNRKRLRTIQLNSLIDPELGGASVEIGGYMPRGASRGRLDGVRKLRVGIKDQDEPGYIYLKPEEGRAFVYWKGTERGPFMFYRGNYSATEDYYDVQDAARDSGTIYLCIQANGTTAPAGVKPTSNTNYWLPLGGGGGSAVQRVTINANGIFPDYLACTPAPEGSPSSGTINVAKPRNLQETPWSGQIVGGYRYDYIVGGRNRVGLTDGSILFEIVTPWAYYEGEEIYVAKSQTMTDVLVGGERLEWVDVNVIARRWEASLTEVLVCVDGEAKKILVRGGPPY